MKQLSCLQQNQMFIHIDALNLTAKTSNCLKREGIWTLGQLLSVPESEFKHLSGVNAARINEIDMMLADMGYERGQMKSVYGPAFNYAASPSTLPEDYARTSYRRACGLVQQAYGVEQIPQKTQEQIKAIRSLQSTDSPSLAMH